MIRGEAPTTLWMVAVGGAEICTVSTGSPYWVTGAGVGEVVGGRVSFGAGLQIP